METTQEKGNKKLGSYVFTGCLFLGIVCGVALDSPSVAVAIGMGIGFVAGALIEFKRRRIFESTSFD